MARSILAGTGGLGCARITRGKASRSMPSLPWISRVPAPIRAACSRGDTTSSLRRGSPRTASRSCGLPGTIRTCPGTAPLFIWRRSATAALSASRTSWQAARRNPSSSRNGRPTAQESCSSPTAPAGGISTASISRAGARSRSCRWRRSSGCRNGCSGCPATRLSGAAASSVPIPKRDWVSSPCWTSRADRCARSRRRFRNSARYVPTVIGWYSAPGHLTFPPASSRSISPRAATPS